MAARWIDRVHYPFTSRTVLCGLAQMGGTMRVVLGGSKIQRGLVTKAARVPVSTTLALMLLVPALAGLFMLLEGLGSSDPADGGAGVLILGFVSFLGRCVGEVELHRE
jgi:hypothetical protein